MMVYQKMKWLIYCVLIALFLILLISEVGLINSVKNALVSTPDNKREKFAVVFDGGSTGTRVHIFRFSNSTGGMILQDEYFEEIKPGLSSYADIPVNAALSIKTLLDKAKSVIPNERWYDTPISLKATAGLRLLPTEQSDAILDEVLSLVKNSPFHCDQNCVGVLDGEDEGIFAWFTMNFLFDYMSNLKKSVAVLDLGGGSTQVTFAPSDSSTFTTSPNGFIVNRDVLGKTITLYSHSYLGLGLMTARYNILKATSEEYDSDDGETTLRSPCLAGDSKASWRHGLEQFTVRGLESGEHSFELCQKRILEFLNGTVHKPAELQKKDVFAVSYYIDRAIELGIIGPGGGVTTVQQFTDGAKKECSKKSPTKPFLCLDATYIAALLRHGLGFSKHKGIHLVEKVEGIEASWGLGAAFSLL